MSARRSAGPRGMTLVEMTISVAIMLVVVSAAAAVIIAGSNMAAAAERRGTAEDAARSALEVIARSAVNAGMGAPGGLYIRRSGVNELINPVFGKKDEASGTDGLWLMVAHRNALREPSVPPDCDPPNPKTPGSAAVNYTTGTGPLQVSCSTAFSEKDTLIITNGVTAALIVARSLSDATEMGPAVIDFEGSTTDFSNAPARGGFRPGDLVYGVRLVHYFIQTNPQTKRPALYAASGAVNAASGDPFVDLNPVVVQDHIEDLQVKYLLASSELNSDPKDFQELDELDPAFTPLLRAIDVAVVATTASPQRMVTSGLRSIGPMSVMDHDRSADPPDGFERVVYRRRIELPNLAPSML